MTNNAHNTQRKTAPARTASQDNAPKNSNSLAAQQQRLLSHLQAHGSVSTIEDRRELDILGVAQRIADLRHKYGQKIDMVWIDQPTDCGRLHRVGRYVLQPGEA